MARSEIKICDVCGKPTEKISKKLFISEAGRVTPSRAPHSEYTHHLDVGVCCDEKLLKAFKWRKRMSAEQYNAMRRIGARK